MRQISHIRVSVPEPGALTRLLFGEGTPPIWLRIDAGGEPRIVAWTVSDSAPEAPVDAPRAVILATVDSDRAAAELREQYGDDWADMGADEILGASCRRLSLGGGWLVLAEPNSEGYTAACLARFGEGPIAVAVQADAVISPTGGRRAASNPVDGGPATYLRIGSGTAPTFILLAV